MFDAGVGLVQDFIWSLIPKQYLIRIRIPEDSNTVYIIPKLEKIKGIQNFYPVDDGSFIGFAEWREKTLDKRIKSIYIVLPDFSLVEVKELES